jgi:hypothetical protein
MLYRPTLDPLHQALINILGGYRPAFNPPVRVPAPGPMYRPILQPAQPVSAAGPLYQPTLSPPVSAPPITQGAPNLGGHLPIGRFPGVIAGG